MQKRNRILGRTLAVLGTVLLVAGQGAISMGAQGAPAGRGQQAAGEQARRQAGKGQQADAALNSDQEAANIQAQLLKLLRMSPTLTTVVSADPSLLADQPYVTRNNPELARFLSSHPMVARNPDFYLFNNLDVNHWGGHREQALKRAVWPDLSPAPAPQSAQNDALRMRESYQLESQRIRDNYEYSYAGQQERAQNNRRQDQAIMLGVFVFLYIVAALLWLIHMMIETRRWNRRFKLQSEVHSRLIEKFSSSQELVSYMETEAGKQFFGASSASLGAGGAQGSPSPMARMLTPLHVGIVMTMLGLGLLLVFIYTGIKTLALGILVLTPGIGFILSAVVSAMLARRLGLMPWKPSAAVPPTAPSSEDRP